MHTTHGVACVWVSKCVCVHVPEHVHVHDWIQHKSVDRDVGMLALPLISAAL